MRPPRPRLPPLTHCRTGPIAGANQLMRADNWQLPSPPDAWSDTPWNRGIGGAACSRVSELHARLGRLAAQTIDPQTARELRKLLEPRSAPGQDRQLTTRQVDVLALVALRLTNDGIASRLGLSTFTVKGYLRSAMARLDAQTRYQVVIEARRLGLLP
jgi:LuxR family transcriptional regulator, regulator of acetate metabolism